MLAAACANAHGYVADLIIADKHYKGNEPAGAKNPSVIRQVSDVSPVKGATNTNINCGLNATPPHSSRMPTQATRSLFLGKVETGAMYVSHFYMINQQY